MVPIHVESAAERTRARIRRCREGQPPPLQRALAQLEQSLFQKGLTVSQLARASGVGQTALHRLFRERLGKTPWAFIRECRMEVAGELLRCSDLEIWQIAAAVGYTSTTGFSKLFSTWAGESPRTCRHRATAENLSMPDLRDRDFLRRVISGDVEGAEVELLVHNLQSLYGIPPGGSSSFDRPEPEFYEEVMAELMWRRIAGKPAAEQKRIVRNQYGFRTPAFFHLLVAKSREDGGDADREHAVALAELAVASVEAVVETLGSDLPEVRSRASEWLAEARRRAGNSFVLASSRGAG